LGFNGTSRFPRWFPVTIIAVKRFMENKVEYVKALQELESLATKGKMVFDGRYQRALKNYKEAKSALLNNNNQNNVYLDAIWYYYYY
jgi:hypothetical protein